MQFFLPNDPDSPEIWGPFAEDTIQSLRCRRPLHHFWAWRNGSYEGINIDPDQIIETGSKLYNKNNNTYGGSTRESLIRMHIYVDVSTTRKRNVIERQQRQYFGEVKYFFKRGCIIQGKICEKILAFVELYKLNQGNEPWPYKTENGGKQRIVVEASDIIGFAGCTKGMDTREYIYWSQKNNHTKKEFPINYKLEYIPK